MKWTPDWPRAPLAALDAAKLDVVAWKSFTRDEAQAIAEGWNAGVTTAQMCARFPRQKGVASFRILIGKLTQLGVPLRKARDVALLASPIVETLTARPAPVATDAQIARLTRLAAFDPVAKRSLDELLAARAAA